MSASTLYSPVGSYPATFAPPPTARSLRWGSSSSSRPSVSQKPLPPNPTPTNQKDSAEGRSFFQVWWKELSTCFLILAALFAIVGTVLPYQDKPLPQWPFSLSINTLVSIYVAILKFTMAFVLAECIGQIKWTWFEHPRPLTDLIPYDDASRGSLWGSLKLLWTLRGRSALASVGAIVTVLSAIIDPFAQQLVQYNSCNRQASDGNASLPITHMWQADGGLNGPGSENAGYGMQGAIANGLFSTQPLDPVFTCSTGNCTFPDNYYTLGFCSVCEDVTSEIAEGVGPVTATNTYAMAKTVVGITTTITATGTLTDDSGQLTTATATGTLLRTATTQEGLAFATDVINSPGYSLKSGLSVGGPQGNFRVNVDLSKDTTQPATIVIETLYAKIMGQSNLTMKNDSDTRWRNRGLGAVRCGIRPCVQGYKASVENGKLHERLVETSYDASWSVTPTIITTMVVRTACVQDANQRAALQQQAQIPWDKMPEWYPYNPAWRNKNATGFPFNDHDMPLECMYMMDTSSLRAISVFLSEFFTGSLQVDRERNTQSIYQLDALWRNGDASFSTINSTIHNITRSMTNLMRESKFSNQTTGQLFTQQVCVSVDWRWLSFPATLTFLTLVCFVATSIVTHRKAGDDLRAHDFKTAVLPLMFAAAKLHQPPHDAQCSGVQNRIEESVKKRCVKFERDGDGWYFNEVQPGGMI